MQKRLISQNIIQCNNQSCPQFTALGSLVAYKTDSTIRVKTCSKDVREIQIKLADAAVSKWFFCTGTLSLLLIVEYAGNVVEVYHIDIVGNQVKHKLVDKLMQAKNAVPLRAGLAYISEDKIAKMYNYDSKNSTSICQCPQNSTIIPHEGQQIFILCPSAQNPDTKLLRIFTKTSINFEQSPLNIDYIKNPLAIFRDQYIFEQNKPNKEIEIYNISLSKIVGKFGYEGQLIKVILKGTILLIIASKQNMDRYYFYTLNTDPTSKSILSYRSVYEKGKGSHFQAYNCSEAVGEQIVQGKAVNLQKEVEDVGGSANQVLLIYIQPAKKNKIEIMRISNTKIKDEAFRQSEMDKIILSKTDKKQKGISHQKIKSQKETLEIEKARVGASMNHRKSEKTVQQLQKAIIDHVVDIKIKGLMDKFQLIERRLNSIQDQIVLIYEKIERSLQKINREEIKKNVESIFDRVTPQFESYFKQVFRQISGVMDQGVSYYTMKLAKQSQVHRDAFNQIINMTFDAAQEITDLGRKELQCSEKTSESIEKLVQIRKKWESQVGQVSENFKIPRTVPESNNHEITLNQPLSPDKKPSPQSIKKKN